MPGLVIYGGDDQVGPFSVADQVSTAMIKGSAFKVYSGAPDGITGTHRHQLCDDLLA